MEAYKIQDLKSQILAVIEDFTDEREFQAKVACRATLSLDFVLDVQATVEGTGLELKDASGEKLRLVIEDSGEFDEYTISNVIEEAAHRKLEDLDEDDLLELARDTGYSEIADIEVDDIDDIEEV